MPEQTIIFRDRYEVTADDLNNAQTNRQDALDHVVSDTIEANNRYWGFAVSQASSTVVSVGSGRLYYQGKVYYNDTSGGTSIDLLSVKPNLQSKVVAIVAAPLDQQTDLEERDFEIDVQSETYEPQTVAVLQQRWASLQAVPGIEAVSPVNPIIPTTAVVLAYVTMTTAGITSIVTVTANQVPNLDDVATRTSALEGEFSDVEARTLTISDELAQLKAAMAGLTDLQMIFSLAQDVARLKAGAKLPSAYVNYRENDFVDATMSNPAYTGYAAKIYEGLRFADDAVASAQLQIFNAYDPLAKISGGGLLLPAYTPETFRIVEGSAGYMSLTQYATQTYGLVQATMSRQRVRYGAEFEEAANSAFFSGGSFSNLGANGVEQTFSKNGENFQVYDTGQVNPDGVEIYRLANYWADNVTQPYWQRLTTQGSATGYAWCQTWVQNQSGWCVAIAPRVATKPASGTLTFGICGTTNGNPDLSNILAQVTVNAADVIAAAGLDIWDVPIEPTFLEAGGRYGLFLITGAAYTMQVADIEANAGGTCFYALDGGVWYPNPSQNIMFDLQFASFKQNQVSINLGSLSLSGGIAAIDVLANAVVPSNTVLTYEMQINSSWVPMQETDTSALASLPPLVPFRVTMTGTPNLMPGLTLSGSVCNVSRPKTTLKHGSTTETLASASDKITVKSTLVDFDPAHHTYAVKITPAGGTLTVADTTTDVTIDSRTIERTQVFNLGAAVSSYVAEEDATTDSAARLFHVSSVFEFAE